MSYTHLCRKPEIVLDELPDHDYDYISVFQEADLKSTTGNPQPSTAGDNASEFVVKGNPKRCGNSCVVSMFVEVNPVSGITKICPHDIL